MQTPMSSTFFGVENIVGVKEGCEGDVQSEILAGRDWARCGSPPLTPGTSFIYMYHFHVALSMFDDYTCSK